MKFRKKPVVIEAMQWDGSIQSADEIEVWSNGITECCLNGDMKLVIFIKTLEGIMQASMNDWIIKGVADEFYSCRSDIFYTTYEKVED